MLIRAPISFSEFNVKLADMLDSELGVDKEKQLNEAKVSLILNLPFLSHPTGSTLGCHVAVLVQQGC